MRKVTIGREFNPGAVRCIYHEEQEIFLDERQENECYMLVLICEGTCMINIGGVRYIASAPCLLCINEKEKALLIENHGISAQTIYFHPSFLNYRLTFEGIRDSRSEAFADRHDRYLMIPFINRDEKFNGIVPLDPIVHQRIGELFRYVGEELRVQRDGYWSCRTRSYFMEILIALERKYTSNTMNPVEICNLVVQLKEGYEDMQNILLHIHTKYFEPINVSELSQIFHTNRTTLSKRFKEATGCTVVEYINKFRVYIACAMLRGTRLHIKEIAERLGFMDDNHFIRVFRKYMGSTPIKYRESQSSKKSG